MKQLFGMSLVAVMLSAITLIAQEKKEPAKDAPPSKPAPAAKDAPPAKDAPTAKDNPKEAPPANAGSDDLYPLKKDNTWIYEVSGGEITVKCVGHDSVGGVDCFKLETTANGKVSATEHVKVEKDGIYRYAVNGTKPDMPIKFLALPPDDKTAWSVDTKVMGQQIKGNFVLKKEDVTIGGTTYKATLVESKDLKIGGMETSIKQWFAPGVGIVKLDFKLGGQDAELKLKKFEPGK